MYCERKNVEKIVEHVCTKNYTGSSTSMEADIIVQGFQSSMKMYNVKYNKIIDDGDSSVYCKIIQSRPYDYLTVEKIEYRNHLLRNYCSKLQELTKNTSYKINERKLLSSRRK